MFVNWFDDVIESIESNSNHYIRTIVLSKASDDNEKFYVVDQNKIKNLMKTSVQHTDNNIYKITITSNTEEEKTFLESPFSEIKNRLYQYFDTAVKEKLGDKAEIEHYVNESNLPYEVLAMVSFTGD